MPIQPENGFLVTHDLTHVSCLGLETDRMDACLEHLAEKQFRGVFGAPCFGFHGEDLHCLASAPDLRAVWFWDIQLKDIEGLYALRQLEHFGVHPRRPPIDFSRFPELHTASIEPRTEDCGLDALSRLRRLFLSRCPPRNRSFDFLPLPESLEELGISWSSADSLACLPALPELRRLQIERCRNLVELGDLVARFPRLEHLVVDYCGRLDTKATEEAVRVLPHLNHAFVQGEKLV